MSRAQNDLGGKGLTSWQPLLLFPVPALVSCPKNGLTHAAWYSLGSLCTLQRSGGLFRARRAGDFATGPLRILNFGEESDMEGEKSKLLPRPELGQTLPAPKPHP